MRVAATCIQLIRDLDDWRPMLESAGLAVTVPTFSGQHLEGDELVAALHGCVGVVAGDDQFTRGVLERLPELRVISKWGIGIDGIDQEAARARGIVVRNTPGMFDDEVADVTMAYIVMLARELVQIDRSVRAGGWLKPAGTSLRGRTLGIVGLGGIGRAVAVRAAAAGMTLLGSDPSPDSRSMATELGVECTGIDDLLAGSDFVSINCPLNAVTHHLFDDRAFGILRAGARIVNTGRGAVVETAALLRALERGIVRAAALDVMEDEPLGADHPLAGFEQVVFGSHNASNTLEASARVHERAIGNLIEELQGTTTDVR